MRRYRIVAVVVFASLTAPVFASDTPGKVTILRDNWGVPYVFAATDADAAYGLGYAQAEDRLDDLFLNVRTAVGRLSEVFGRQYVDQDYAIRMIKNAEHSEQTWESFPAELKAVGEAYVRGVQAYMAKHPESVPDFAVDLHAWQLYAIGRTMIMRWPLGQIQDEIRNTQNSNGFGSNEWSVAPARTEDNVAVLLTDPHLTWEGMAVFYEAHVFGDALEMHGYFLVGSPLMAFGHNGNVGWAPTTGGPDTADVYEMKLNPQNPTQYMYDGESRAAKIETIQIPVKGQDPVSRLAAYTHLGPLFSEPNYQKGTALVGATPYLESTQLMEQVYRMNTAKDADAFYEALGMNQYMEQNIMFADRGGNIQYVRVGRVPIRPKGYDWLKAVPGSTSETAWRGIHPIGDLVQIRNPEAGYMQNCNISPANMMINSPLTPDGYPSYIYNVSWDKHNTRAMRALELLHNDESVSKDDAKAFAMDVHDVLADAWKKAVADAAGSAGARFMKDEAYADAVAAIKAWDGQWVKESRAAAIMWYLRRDVQGKVDIDALLAREVLSEKDARTVADGLLKALDTMEKVYGNTDVTWGDVHKVGRSGRYFPVDGVVFGSGTQRTRTLFNVGAREQEKGSGVYIANSGSMSMMLMFFHEDEIEAYTCTQWGQSANPDSPHHLDQAEKLYSQRKFKRSWTTKEQVMPHVESTLVLETT